MNLSICHGFSYDCRADIAKPIAEELLKRNPENTDIQAFVRFLSVQEKVTSTKAPPKK